MHIAKKINTTCIYSLFVCLIVNSPQVLFKSVSECLSLAASKGHKTITFPAIGTGGLGFNKREAARTMLQAVADFAKNKPKKMEVNFVIFPSDNDTFQVCFRKWPHYIRLELLYQPCLSVACGSNKELCVSNDSSTQQSKCYITKNRQRIK